MAQPTTFHTEFVQLEAPDAAKRSFMATVGTSLDRIAGYKPAEQTSDTATYRRKWTPTWVVVCCIVLFPIGLLTLLTRRDVALLARFVPHGGDTLIVIDGEAQPTVIKQINDIAEQLNKTARDEYARRHPATTG
jgi:hypothetical protein